MLTEKNTFSYGIDIVLIPIGYGQIRKMPSQLPWHYLPLWIFYPCLISDSCKNLAADLPGPVNNARTGTNITDKI